MGDVGTRGVAVRRLEDIKEGKEHGFEGKRDSYLLHQHRSKNLYIYIDPHFDTDTNRHKYPYMHMYVTI